MRQAEYDMVELQLMRTIFPHYAYTHATDLPGTWLALDEAQEKLEEAQQFLEQGDVTEAQALLGQVKDSLDKAEEKSEARVWAVPLSVKLAELQLDEAKAALDMAKAELAKATITAPFDSIVAGIEIKEGEQLSAMAYANPAICLVDISEIKLSGLIDEIDISKVKLGQNVTIALDALPDKELTGNVTFISQAGTSQMGVVSYKTTITLENPDEELRDGMSATADIITDRRENVLLIPNRAIQGSLKNPYVEVVTDDKTEQRNIILGLSDGAYTEILSGLEEGEVVVLPPVSQIPFISFGG
jgi:HlyD family secretion protein